MDVRVALAVVLLAGVGTALGWALLAQPDGAGGDGGLHEVRVVGRDGELWNGTVQAAGGTALDALLAAGQAGGFPVDVEHRASFTGEACAGMYVAAVAGQREAGSGGWMYDIVRGGTTRTPSHSAACQALAPGDAVVWRWVASGV